MSPLDQILKRASSRPKRIAFPEAEDTRTLAAVKRLAMEGIVLPVLVGACESVRSAAERAGVDLEALAIEIGDYTGDEPGRKSAEAAIARPCGARRWNGGGCNPRNGGHDACRAEDHPARRRIGFVLLPDGATGADRRR
jgi:hypothetical protein